MSNRQTIETYLRLVKEPGEIFELRTQHAEECRKTRYHGFYDNQAQAARDAEDFPGDCYVTVNRIKQNRQPTNELIRCKKGACTKASNIERRTLLYLDIDPDRPSNTSATDEQLGNAIDLCNQIVKQVPLSRPILGETGNGACAFWKIDQPPDSPLVKYFLKAIKAKYDTPEVKVDPTVASRARIGRLLGTDNYKGGKRGRESTIISAPDTLEIVTEEMLSAYAPTKQTEDSRAQQLASSWTFGRTPQEQTDNIRILLNTKGIHYCESDSPDSQGTLCHWFHFDCRFRPGHNDAQNWIKVHPIEGVSAGCHHAKCRGKGLVELLQTIAPEIASQAAEKYNDSYRLARSFLCAHPPLVIWQRSPFTYHHGVYREESEESVKASLNRNIKQDFDALGFSKTPNVTNTVVNNVLSAVKALTYSRNTSAPHWRNNEHPPANEYLAFRNGLLHVPSYLDGKFHLEPLTPDYFTLAKLPYDFDPNAPAPKHFIEYCQFQWDDANAHLLLEEMLGDILLADPRLRTFYNWLGKAYAGKSSLMEMAESLVGEENRCAVDLLDFASDFGLEKAVSAKLILVSEARVDARHSSNIAEKIKRISGNDLINIKRKFKSPLSVRLNAKILAVSNHLPKLLDESGALFDRLIPLQFTRRVPKENEDIYFPLKLKSELSGIVLLALNGWKRLRDNGGFTLPESSVRLLNELREAGSPTLTFIEHICQLQQDQFTPTDILYDKWVTFCNERDLPAGNMEDFVVAMRSAAPELRKCRRRYFGEEKRGFMGIAVKQ